MRHGEALNKSPDGSDFGRDLSNFGVQHIQEQARKLRSLSLSPDLILHSSAKRTTHTAQIVAGEFATGKLIAVDGLYNASEKQIIKEIESGGNEADILLLVAHNPGVSWLSANLTTQSIPVFNPGMIAVFEFDLKSWNEISYSEGVLQDLLS